MTLYVNGHQHLVPGFFASEPLAALLVCLAVRREMVAVALNDIIVPRDQWSKTSVSDGDTIEIVHFVGGGSSR
jgi:sulfur carrier protein